MGYMKVCSTEGCGRRRHAKGFCSRCYDKHRYWADPEAARERDKAKYEKARERYRLKNERFRKNNPQRVKELWADWYAKNRAKACETSRQRRLSDPERHKEWCRQWAKANPEKTRLNAKNRKALRKSAAGRFTLEEWRDRVAEYGGICPRCERAWAKPTVDHIVPLSRGGSNYIWNIQPLCAICNTAKKNYHATYYPPPIYSK